MGEKKYKTEIMYVGMDSINRAAILLRDGQVVAIPTETVYGLAANALDKKAIKRIYTAKARPSDNPLIVHVHSMQMAQTLVESIPQVVHDLADRFWPGPLTIILKKKEIVPDIVTGDLDTVAIRMPSHPVALGIIEHSGLPLAAPSANLSGRPSPTNAQDVYSDMQGRIPLIIDGGTCQVGVESTVLDMTTDIPTILRPGAVTSQMIEQVIGQVIVSESVMEALADDDTPRSPGTKYRHYAPNADITIVRGIDISVSRYINRQILKDNAMGKKSVAVCFSENSRNYNCDTIVIGSIFAPEVIAESLFATLRRIDSDGYERAYFQYLEGDNIEMAIMNRLLKASNHDLVVMD